MLDFLFNMLRLSIIEIELKIVNPQWIIYLNSSHTLNGKQLFYKTVK
jgi:hypothetical protein